MDAAYPIVGGALLALGGAALLGVGALTAWSDRRAARRFGKRR